MGPFGSPEETHRTMLVGPKSSPQNICNVLIRVLVLVVRKDQDGPTLTPLTIGPVHLNLNWDS